MAEFLDSFNQKRAVTFNKTECGKWVNLTIYTPAKTTYGNTLQIPLLAFKELVNEVNEITVSG